MSNHEDLDEDALAKVDLRAWRVPSPVAIDRAALVTRALSPAVKPRRRVSWMVAALALANVALAAVLILVLVRPEPQPAVAVQAAGGGSVDAQAKELLLHLQQEQLELERKVADVQRLRDSVEDLAHKLRECELTAKHTTTPPTPAPTPPPGPTPAPSRPEPTHDNAPSCDEVSCVLNNYEGACCTKFHRRTVGDLPPPSSVPEWLDRDMFYAGLALVRDDVSACGDTASVHGRVLARIHVNGSGEVDAVDVEKTSNAALDACIAASIKRAHFTHTQHGGKFRYPVPY